MKKVLAFLSSLLLVGAMQAYAAETPVVAVVNVQQIFQQSPKIADLNKKLQTQFKSRQDNLIARQKALQEEADKYRKEEPTMTQAQKETMQKKITTEQASLSKDAATFQDDLNKEQRKAMSNVLTQLNGVISGIAKKNNYSLVLDSQAVIYAADTVDVTKQVSKEFDKK